jgi:hypothetical protein
MSPSFMRLASSRRCSPRRQLFQLVAVDQRRELALLVIREVPAGLVQASLPMCGVKTWCSPAWRSSSLMKFCSSCARPRPWASTGSGPGRPPRRCGTAAAAAEHAVVALAGLFELFEVGSRGPSCRRTRCRTRAGAWAQLWRMRYSASSDDSPVLRSMGVTSSSVQSRSITVERSHNSPSIFAPMTALARPAPMSFATSWAVTGWSNSRVLPSGRVMHGAWIAYFISAGNAARCARFTAAMLHCIA